MPYLTLIADLFVLSVLAIAWWSFDRWIRTRFSFYAALYLFLLACGIVGYLATVRVAGAAYVTGPLSLIGIVLFIYLSHARNHEASSRNGIRQFAALALIILTLGSSTLYVAGRRNEERRFETLNARLTGLSRRIDDKASEAAALAKNISLDENVLPLIKDRNYASLTATLQNSMLSHDLSFIIVTDPSGNVVSRPHQPSRIMDNLFEEAAWPGQLFAGNQIKGIAYNEDQLPVVLGGQPVLNGDKLIGTITVGYAIDQQFLLKNGEAGTAGIGVVKDGMLVASRVSSPTDSQAIATADFSDAVVKAREQSSWQTTFSYDGRRLAAAGLRLATLVPGHSLQLISLDSDNASAH